MADGRVRNCPPGKQLTDSCCVVDLVELVLLDLLLLKSELCVERLEKVLPRADHSSLQNSPADGRPVPLAQVLQDSIVPQHIISGLELFRSAADPRDQIFRMTS